MIMPRVYTEGTNGSEVRSAATEVGKGKTEPRAYDTRNPLAFQGRREGVCPCPCPLRCHPERSPRGQAEQAGPLRGKSHEP